MFLEEPSPSLRDFKSNSIIILLLYLYLFQPPVIDKLYFLIIELFLFSFLLLKNGNAILNCLKFFKVEICIILILIFFSLSRDLISEKIVYSDRFLAWGFQSFIFGGVIISLTKKSHVSLFNLLYWTCLFAAICTALLLLIPPFDEFYKSIQLDGYYERYADFEVRYRAYGIAENLTFTYAFVMGLFAGYSFLQIKKNYFFIIPMFLFLLAAVFNARIGMIPFIYIIFFSVFIKRDITNTLHSVICLTLIFICSLLYIHYQNLDISSVIIFSNSDWVFAFFEEIASGAGTVNTLFGRFIVFPDENLLQILFGTGESLFEFEEGNSDIGFIIQFYYAGLFFLLTIVCFILFCSVRLFKHLGFLHWFTTFFIFHILILNTKGFVFAATPGGRLIFLLYMYFIFKKISSTQFTNHESYYVHK